MSYNQAHNYDPAITLANKEVLYPEDFVAPYMEKLSQKIAENGDIDSYLLRGSFYLQQGEYPKAIADFSAILEKDPQNLLALFNRAAAQMHMYDYIESIDNKTTRVVGEIKQESRKIDYSQVLKDYQQCLTIDPDFVFARYNMANVYAKSEEIDKAIAAYTEVIRQDKDIAEAYYNRGILYIYIGKKALANADLSKAGELGIADAYNIIKRYCGQEEE